MKPARFGTVHGKTHGKMVADGLTVWNMEMVAE